MYAVIRAGGKQYRVAPGDILKVEKLPNNEGENVAFNDVVAVSAEDGKIGPAKDAVVTGQITASGRNDKILVFHYKRKKQYKKIYGHRQPFTEVRITEIAVNGQRFTAPELPQRKRKAAPKPAAPQASAAGEEGAAGKVKAAAPKKTAAKKTAAKKAAPKTKK